MQRLRGPTIGEDPLFREHWQQRLPHNTPVLLSAGRECLLEETAVIADDIVMVQPCCRWSNQISVITVPASLTSNDLALVLSRIDWSLGHPAVSRSGLQERYRARSPKRYRPSLRRHFGTSIEECFKYHNRLG
ncbi:hypothetical protein D915_005367 [Fasciola hepatica]|uniref:Uncharacterized protein n=1 Tax=Fasciola hepatica TaxID=6192 RepID=A0A4E0RAW7_FASHE|nr:hypothetical protein D915_005367 [Fasciola hepatica]